MTGPTDAVNILSIGGSDPSSGAGIQSDIKASQLLDAYCFTVVTAVTSQNTSRYLATTPVPAAAVRRQIKSVTSDFDIDVIKIGMVYDSKIISALHMMLKRTTVPIVVDPVIRSTTGGTLLKRGSVTDYRKKIVPLSHAITPNLSEAETLSGIRFRKKSDIERMSSRIAGMGAKNVIITGIEDDAGGGGGGKITDHVRTPTETLNIAGRRIGAENHGGGCTYSTALAASVARGDDIVKAARFAKGFAAKSIAGAKKIGRGAKIAHQGAGNRIMEKLSSGIAEFVRIRNIHSAIPECQTNLVFSRPCPESAGDILGLSGRIVRSGKRVLVAGELEYGGSRHVAAAVLAVSRRFPEVRSAVNIRYDPGILDGLRRNGMHIRSYDRGDEPKGIKGAENSSVRWGVQTAIKKSVRPPDVIFHEGDVGKEPMILVFGTTPQDVTGKIRGIL